MNHLTIEEIIEFVSSTELNSEFLTLSVTVNGHIRKCPQCLEQVRSFQMIYDAFCEENRKHAFKAYCADCVSTAEAEGDTDLELQDGFM